MLQTGKTVRAVLWTQIALAVVSLVLAVLALVSSTGTRFTSQGMTVVTGAVVSVSVLIYGVLLIVAGALGLIALRRRDRVWFLRAGIALLAPAIVAVGSALSTGEQEGGAHVLMSTDTFSAFERTLRLMEWASWLALAAMVLATLSAVLLLLLRRKVAGRTA